MHRILNRVPTYLLKSYINRDIFGERILFSCDHRFLFTDHLSHYQKDDNIRVRSTNCNTTRNIHQKRLITHHNSNSSSSENELEFVELSNSPNSVSKNTREIKECGNPSEDLQKVWQTKIIYSTFLEKYTPPRSWKWLVKEHNEKPEREANELFDLHKNQIPVALRYLESELDLKENMTIEENLQGIVESQDTGELQFPFKIFSKTTLDLETIKNENSSSDTSRTGAEYHSKLISSEEATSSNNDCAISEWSETYGIPDPHIPASSVPCGGCGAFLHCQDTSIPGYLPSERFKLFTKMELKSEICQRCYFLQNHKAALNVNVSPDMYPKILSQIRNEFAMVLLVVDLLDFPCSIWPGIIDIIGRKRPVMLVGNKIDLLPRDSSKYLQHIEHCLRITAKEAGLDDVSIIHTALISATTGYGIEELITSIHRLWGSKGHIFIMGCTNVGKSSLFNAFIQSDLCKVQVVDLIQRATVSQWPGTTLNLLKFPVMRPDSWRQYYRGQRLQADQTKSRDEESLKLMQLKAYRDPVFANLNRSVGRTFMNDDKIKDADKTNESSDIFHVNYKSKTLPEIKQVGNWDPQDPVFSKGKWCYDSPGTVSENQILDVLTLQELMKVLPKKLIEPRSYFIKPGVTLFVGGIARLDYIKGEKPIRYTVFSSDSMPITVVKTEDADEVYEKALGTPILGIPMGDSDRLSKFPKLKSTKFGLEGIDHKLSCADIVLSSAGWVAVTIGIGKFCELEVHTPNGKGLFCRQPSLLPNTINLKGRRIRNTPAYSKHRLYVPV